MFKGWSKIITHNSICLFSRISVINVKLNFLYVSHSKHTQGKNANTNIWKDAEFIFCTDKSYFESHSFDYLIYMPIRR